MSIESFLEIVKPLCSRAERPGTIYSLRKIKIPSSVFRPCVCVCASPTLDPFLLTEKQVLYVSIYLMSAQQGTQDDTFFFTF